MTDIDLSKYDGADQYLSCECGAPPLSRHDCEHRRAYVAAQTDAPLLLTEVKRLDLEHKAAERELLWVRQSHARLLAAIKASRGGTGVCTCSTSSCAELRAAVAEAEGL